MKGFGMEGESKATEAVCIICRKKASFSKLTAGALYADGKQAFACFEHVWNRAMWLLGWAKFAIEQSRKIGEPNTATPAETAYGRVFS